MTALFEAYRPTYPEHGVELWRGAFNNGSVEYPSVGFYLCGPWAGAD
jgi:hypothetical protein